ncbi:MAG: FISUMP domain-containing protein [Bacteroidota bacterium]
MNNVSPNLFRTAIFSLVCILIVTISCNKDDGPPPDPCAQTPLLTVAAEAEDFAITASASGGEAPYSFQLDDGDFQTSGNFTGLSAKEYTITVQDANDCSNTTKVAVVDPCAEGTLVVEALSEGTSITVTADGGTAPYTFSIDGQTFQEEGLFSGLDFSEYTITVKDANYCTNTVTVAVVDPCGDGTLGLEATVDGFDITATATGGTAPYTYSIDGETFQESNVFKGVEAGNYTITVQDANGCTFNASATVIDPCAEGTLDVQATVDGFDITATATGGTEPYTYSIDGETFQNNGVFVGLDIDDYTVTVKDANDCTDIIDITVVDVCATLAVQATAEAYTITGNASGGTEPYTYSLDGETFQENNVFASLDIGDYTLTVKDANDCLATVEVTNSCDTSGLEVTATAELYEINASGNGGEAPYTYSIDGVTFQNSGVFADLPPQNYTVTIKDAKQCTSTFQVTAEQLESFTDPRDEQTYKVVTIGGVIWMAENLNYQREGVGYSCPDNDDANCATHGALYTWDDAQLAAPEGWHLPAPEEWDALIEMFGGNSMAGDDLKLGGNSRLNMLISGFGIDEGNGYNMLEFGEIGYYWRQQELNANDASFVVLLNLTSTANLNGATKELRLSVRCVKD